MGVPARGASAAAVMALVAVTFAGCSNSVEVATGAGSAADDGLPPFCDDVEPVPGTVQGRPGVEDDHLLAVVEGYGSARATYGGLWYDPARGTLVVAFTDDPEPHRAAISDRLTDGAAAFDVVQVERTFTELAAVHREVGSMLQRQVAPPENAYGSGIRPSINRVSIYLALADPDARRELAEAFPADAICVHGPAEPPPEIARDAVQLIADDPDPLVRCGDEVLALSALEQRTGFEAGVSGSCTRLLLPDGLVDADWWLDPTASPPAPGDTTVAVEVIDPTCGGGTEIEERLIGPQVRHTDDEVQVAFAVVPLPPGPPRGCIGHEALRIVVDLGESLGDRVIVDALDAPPRMPVTEREW